MKTRTAAATIALIAVASGCGGSSGCTDDYAPAKETSCSYNPVYASLERERGANIGQVFFETSDGSSAAYLIVDPPRVRAGGEVTFSALNTSSVDVEIGPEYRLEGIVGESFRSPTCAFAEEPIVVGSDEESNSIRFVPCAERRGQGVLGPGVYEFAVSFDAPGAEPGSVLDEVISRFEIVDEGSR